MPESYQGLSRLSIYPMETNYKNVSFVLISLKEF